MAKNESEASGRQTTVEEGTQFKGTLQSNCPVMVRGAVEGDLTAPSVIVSASGAVTGNVKAECIRSEGVLAGHVDATDVYLSGSVRSDTVIRAKTLEVKLQRPGGDRLQVTFGECILDVGEDPRVEAGVDDRRTHAEPAPAAAHAPAAHAGGRGGGSARRGSTSNSTPPKQAAEDESKKRNSVQPPPS